MRILIFTLVVGCTVDGLDLEGRECPCIEGWTCDEARNLCVREAPEDAGLDARLPDGGMDAALDAPVTDAGDDSGTDAGGDASDAAVDVPIDATPPRSTECDELEVLFCEGFEDDLSGWTVEAPGSSETEIVFGPDAFRGRGMLYAYRDAREDYSLAYHRVWDDSETDLWVRVMYFVPSALATEAELFEIFNTGYDYSVPYLVVPGEYADVHAHGIFDDGGWASSIAPGADEWVCVEMHMHRAATGGYIELFLDGAMALRTPDLDIPQPFNELSVGMVYGASEGAVYVDEVVAHNARVPCP